MSLVIFTRPWINDVFLKIIRSSEIFNNLRAIFITEFTKDAERYGWNLLKPLKEDIYECKVGFSVDEVIKRDRLLRNIERKTALKMVANCYKQIDEIISEEKPKFAFMVGVDNYTTDLFVKICEHRNVTILPFFGFFVNGRFRFTKYGEPIYVNDGDHNLNLSEYFKSRNKPVQNKVLKRLTIERRVIRSIQVMKWQFMLKYLKKNREDYRNGNFFSLVHFHKYTAMYKFFLKDLAIKDYFKSDLSGIRTSKPIIYISLHVVPEASIDYWGSIDLMDHDNIVLKLIEDYGADYQFIIKEHPVMFGKRGVSFYDRIKKVNTAILLNPYYDSYSVIEKSDIVLTWSGSVGIEAIFYNKKCINIIKPYYYIDGFTTYVQSRSQLFSDFNAIVGKLKSPNNIVKVAMNKLIDSISCTGSFNDRDIRDDNINKLVCASEAMVKKYE